MLGAVAVILVSETTGNDDAAVPPSLTEVAPVKCVPLIVTNVPARPLVGVKPVIVGFGAAVTTVKLVELVPVPFAVTEIGPVVAPFGTKALMLVSELTVKLVAFVTLNFTAVAPPKPTPVIVTFVPIGPLVGVNELICGPPPLVVTRKLDVLGPVPFDVVTAI